jgi:hypothetical protein
VGNRVRARSYGERRMARGKRGEEKGKGAGGAGPRLAWMVTSGANAAPRFLCIVAPFCGNGQRLKAKGSRLEARGDPAVAGDRKFGEASRGENNRPCPQLKFHPH